MATLENLGFEVEEEGQLELEGDVAPGEILLEGDVAPGELLLEGDVQEAGGDAEGWVRTVVSTARERAAFNSIDLLSEYETYEVQWQSNEDFLTAFGVADVFPAVFDDALPLPEAPEDYEEGWQTNEGFLFSGGSFAAASFDATTPEGFEDYEEEWQTNEGWSGTLGSVSGAVFDAGAVQEEDYEETFPRLPMTVLSIAGDTLTVAAHGLSAADVIEFENEGGRLPAGLTSSYGYFVLVVDPNTIQVEGTLGSGAIDVTDAGVGAHFVLGPVATHWRT